MNIFTSEKEMLKDQNLNLNIELSRLHEINKQLLDALKDMIWRYQGKKQGLWGESTEEMIAARLAIKKAEFNDKQMGLDV